MGLGNPGPEYEGTRHNAGFLLVDHLAARWGFGAFRREGAVRVARGMLRRFEVQLVKPQTYMNRSGSVLSPLRGPGFQLQRDLLVVVDEAALDLGRFRLRSKGSAGGHNGLKSVEASLGTQEYPRLRLGVGPLPEHDDMAEFVLEDFTRRERTEFDAVLDPAADAVETWVFDGIELAMTRHNKKPRPPEAAS